MFTQFYKITVTLLLLLMFLPCLYSTDTSSDRTNAAMDEFITQKVHLVKINPYASHLSAYYKQRYFAVRGNKLKVKMGELALEMGNPVLAGSLKWGELYHPMITGLTLSILSTSVLNVIGLSMLLSMKYMDDYSDTPQTILNNMLVSGVVLFAVSSLSIAGIITFALLASKANSNHLNLSQAQLFIKQYNEHLRKRLGVPISMDLGYNLPQSALNMTVKIKL